MHRISGTIVRTADERPARQNGLMKRVARTILLALVASGCSYQYVDDRGNRHVIGLAHVVTRDPGPGTSDVVAQQVTTIGAAILYVPETVGLSLGYTRNFILQVNDVDTAGELSFNVDNPSSYTYKDFRTILGEHQ